MPVFEFAGDVLFEEAVRKAVKKPTGPISESDIRSITELWCSADVRPSHIMKLAPHTFVHLIAAGPEQAVLDGVILDVVGATGSLPSVGRAFIAGQPFTIDGRERFYPGLRTADGFLPGAFSPTAHGSVFLPGLFAGTTFVPGLATHPAFGHKADAFLPGVLLSLNTVPGQRMLEALKSALGNTLPRALDLRSSIANGHSLFVPGTFRDTTTFQRGMSLELGRCPTAGFDLDRAMSGRARVADGCDAYTPGMGDKQFQCGGTQTVCTNQQTATMGGRIGAALLGGLAGMEFGAGGILAGTVAGMMVYKADKADSPGECLVLRLDGGAVTRQRISVEANQIVVAEPDGSVSRKTLDDTNTVIKTEQVVPPAPTREPATSGALPSKPESGGTCEQPAPFSLPGSSGMPSAPESESGSVPAWLREMLSAWGVGTTSFSPVLWHDPTVLPAGTDGGSSGIPTFHLPQGSNVDPTDPTSPNHTGSAGGAIVVESPGDPTEEAPHGGLSVIGQGAGPSHGLSVHGRRAALGGRRRSVRTSTHSVLTEDAIRVGVLRHAQDVEHYCLEVVMAAKQHGLSLDHYERELRLLADRVFAGASVE